MKIKESQINGLVVFLTLLCMGAMGIACVCVAVLNNMCK